MANGVKGSAKVGGFPFGAAWKSMGGALQDWPEGQMWTNERLIDGLTVGALALNRKKQESTADPVSIIFLCKLLKSIIFLVLSCIALINIR